MKTRNGFVSNSSSSSFIIGWNGDLEDACDVCGRSDPNIINMCRDEACSYSGDSTDVEWEGFDGWIAEWEDEKEQIQYSIKRLEGRDVGEPAYTWGSQTTVAEALVDNQQQLEEIEKKIAKIQMYSVTAGADFKIARVTISYHSTLNSILDTMLNRGTIQEVSINDI